MKRITYISSITFLGLVCLSMLSCNDFLTLYPQDRVVEENFWEDKNDLEGVRYGAYMQMSNTLLNLAVWGDLRSDAYHWNSHNPNSNDYKEIMLGNPDSTMSIFDWGGVYTTINYCNKVLSHGEEVLSKDPQFTPTEWQQMKAEMTGLRALNYFYLIRSFKDIPFTTTVINSDEDVHDYTLTPQMEVLDWLINDVTPVAGLAKSRFPSEKDTKGLITNTTLYALLAEMHLWRGALREGRNYPEADILEDANKVIEYGQKSLDALAKQNEQITQSTFDRNVNKKDDFGSGLTNAMLIKNDDMQNLYNGNSSSITVNSYSSIFKTGNSEESMFELQYSTTDSRYSNFMRTLWGYYSSFNFQIATSIEAVRHAVGSDLLDKDCRPWYSCVDEKYLFTATREIKTQGQLYYCAKWLSASFDKSTSNLCTNVISAVGTSNSTANWIFYRMTDVMLMMAEAYAITGEYEKCRNIVDAIQKRSMLDQTTGLSNKTTDNNKRACIILVMNERLVELLGEGKRWFDLVRYAERIGGGYNDDPREPQYKDCAEGVKDMIETFMKNGYYSQLYTTLISRIQNRYGLYCPIYYRERSANHYLIPQNPVWSREKVTDIPK